MCIRDRLPVDYLLVGVGAALHYDNPEDKQSVELQAKIKEQGVREAAKEITQLTDEKECWLLPTAPTSRRITAGVSAGNAALCTQTRMWPFTVSCAPAPGPRHWNARPITPLSLIPI